MENPLQLQVPKSKKPKKRRVPKAEPMIPKRKKLHEAEEAHHLERILFGNLQDPSFLGFGHEFEEHSNAVISQHKELEPILDDDSLQRKPVWEDEEENETMVNISNVSRLRKLMKVGEDGTVSGKEYISRLRSFHNKLNPSNAWAVLPSEKTNKRRQSLNRTLGTESDDNDETSDVDYNEDDIYDVLRSTDNLVVKNKARLTPGIIGISKMRDANAEEPSNAVVQSVQFHRNSQILLTAGYDKRLRFFQIDGKRNPKIQSIFLDDYPIHKAAFVPDGSRVIASGRRKFYYMYDLNAAAVEKIEPLFGREERSLERFEVSSDSKTLAFLGNDGYILLASLTSKQLIGTLKMNGSVNAVSFTQDGKELLSFGGDGEVYQWDIGTRKCIFRKADDGCIRGTSITASYDSKLFATGANSGVVNLYDKEKFVGGNPQPVKTFMNLVTTVDNLKFNADTQILAMTSKMKQNALKLVHLPSYTVFSNWPTSRTPLHYVHCLDFSPGGGYLAVGNAKGKALLFRLRHYERA